MGTDQLRITENFLQEEVRSDYLVTKDQKKLWAIQLDLLDRLQKFCDLEGIRCYAIGGTHLGAVRHKGYIPWDDDIDVAMPRADYERLCEIAPKAFTAPYFFQTDRTDIGFDRAFARLRNSNTTMGPVCDRNARLPYNQGIYIDILPWDNVPDDEEECREWMREISRVTRKLHILSLASVHYRTEMEKETLVTRLRFISGPVLKFLSIHLGIHNPYLKVYEKLARRYENTDVKRCAFVWYAGTKYEKKLIYDRTDFAEGKKMPFEMLEVTVPCGNEKILELLYGDWKVPRKGTAGHRTTYYDAEKPYDTRSD